MLCLILCGFLYYSALFVDCPASEHRSVHAPLNSVMFSGSGLNTRANGCFVFSRHQRRHLKNCRYSRSPRGRKVLSFIYSQFELVCCLVISVGISTSVWYRRTPPCSNNAKLPHVFALDTLSHHTRLQHPGNKLVDTLACEAQNVRRVPQHNEWSNNKN